MNLLDPEELKQLLPAEEHAFPSPIPTQIVSSDEFMPPPQTRAQQRVEARIKELGDDLARRQGMTRRRFLQTASGMAAAFVAMNEVYGSLYDVSRAEAQTPDVAKERAKALSGQFVMDCHTHSCATTLASWASCASARRWARRGGIPTSRASRRRSRI